MLTLSKGHIFCVKHAVKLWVPSSRNESLAQFANLHSVMTLGADELEHRRFRAREASNLRAEGTQVQTGAVLRDSRNGSSDPRQLHSDWWIGSSRFTYCRLYLSLA